MTRVHPAFAGALLVVTCSACGPRDAGRDGGAARGDAATPPAEPVPEETPVAGAQPSAVLYGRVVGSDQQEGVPADWQVRVTAEYDDGTDVAPRDRNSTGDLFAFKVVPGKRVRLYFEAVPYQSTVTEYVDVDDERRYASRVQDVVLDRIRWSMALFENGNGEAFGRNLEAQAAMAERTGSADIFRTNLEYFRKASVKFPDCMRKIEEFEATPRGAAITEQAQARGVPVALLRQLVMSPDAFVVAQPDAARALASNALVAAAVRRDALRAIESGAVAPTGVAPDTATPSPGANVRPVPQAGVATQPPPDPRATSTSALARPRAAVKPGERTPPP